MKRLGLVALVFFCLVGTVWAAAPNPQLPNLSGGSWRGTVRATNTGAGTSHVVAMKIAVTKQSPGGDLTANLTLDALTITGGHGYIEGNYFSMSASDASGSIYFSGTLGWYPNPRLLVTYISASGGLAYGDSILAPNATP